MAAGKTAENTYAEGIGRGAQVFGGCSQIGRQRVRHCLAVGANRFDIHGVSENNAQMRRTRSQEPASSIHKAAGSVHWL